MSRTLLAVVFLGLSACADRGASGVGSSSVRITESSARSASPAASPTASASAAASERPLSAPPSASARRPPAPSAFASDAPFGSGGLGLIGVGEGGGCPCGCDHSQAMADELRVLGGEDALASIRASVATITEREAAGYVTEAMVQHRLRLLDLRRELGSGGDDTRPAPLRAEVPVVAARGPRVRAELIVHGDSVELVKGREKPLLACFLLRMEVENTSSSAVTLAAPRLDSTAPLPVSRWYAAGSAGQPWDGKLARGEKKAINVIGYVGQPLQPGTAVKATIHVGSAAFEATARARRRWNDPEPAR